MIIKDGEARGRDTYAKVLVAVQMEGEGQRWTSLGGMRATHDVSVTWCSQPGRPSCFSV